MNELLFARVTRSNLPLVIRKVFDLAFKGRECCQEEKTKCLHQYMVESMTMIAICNAILSRAISAEDYKRYERDLIKVIIFNLAQERLHVKKLDKGTKVLNKKKNLYGKKTS